ncbi:DUF550 domain-containing protein [Brucella anthropi]|nr:DUF550 domain-containing protein [Brucella anthropi]
MSVASETIEAYFARQIEWSTNTFGPALRTNGILAHIRKELKEIEAEPHDLTEWIDVVMLAMDGFWRHGGSVDELMSRLLAKQRKNMARTWPDWRTMSDDVAVEHDRSKDKSGDDITDVLAQLWRPISEADKSITFDHTFDLGDGEKMTIRNSDHYWVRDVTRQRGPITRTDTGGIWKVKAQSTRSNTCRIRYPSHPLIGRVHDGCRLLLARWRHPDRSPLTKGRTEAWIGPRHSSEKGCLRMRSSLL